MSVRVTMFPEPIGPFLQRNTLSASMVYSLTFHVGAFVFVWGLMHISLPEEKNEEIAIQVYTGPVTGVEGAGSGVGKGSTRPALKKDSSGISETGKDSKRTGNQEGVEDGFEDGKGVDWGTASDPALDGGSRYTARIVVDVSADDYPRSARRSNLGNVIVGVTLLVSAKGRIHDVQIRYVRSTSGDPTPFKNDFVQATRNIFLRKARLVNVPYSKDGRAQNFKWDTVVTYTLQ